MPNKNEKTSMPGETGSGLKKDREIVGNRRDPEERHAPGPEELREKMHDKTLADSFPTSDPPSSIPDPATEDALHPDQIEFASQTSDPVCHRPIDPGTATIQADYDNRTYFFCSEECKERFQVNPEPYRHAA